MSGGFCFGTQHLSREIVYIVETLYVATVSELNALIVEFGLSQNSPTIQ